MYDVIIIGSGFSSLTAARTLTQLNKSVLILEAQHRIGGRCLTTFIPSSSSSSSSSSSQTSTCPPIDLGCSTIHGWKEGTPVRGLMKEFGLEGYVPKKMNNLISSTRGILPAALLSKLAAAISATSNLLPTDPLIPSTRSLSSYIFSPLSPLYSNLSEDEKEMVESLIRNQEVGLGVTLEEVALKWIGYEDSFKGTDAFPIGGFGKLIEAMEVKIKSDGGVVHLGEQVISITKPNVTPPGEDDSIVVTTSSSRGDERMYEGRLVISTIPLAVLKTSIGIFNPPLSEKKIEAIQGTHVGHLGKLVIQYGETWWGEDIGSITILPSNPGKTNEVDPTSPKELLDTITLVIASLGGNGLRNPHPTLLVYLPAPVTKLLEALPADLISLAVHDLLISRLSPSAPPPPPLQSILTSWSTSPYSLGATSTPPVTSRSPLDFIQLGKPEWDNRLLFGGEHTSVSNRGSVAGAVESGRREGERAQRLLMNWE